MRTEELTLPGFRHDVCSAIHPLGRSSACFSELELDVEWLDSPACVAHPFDDAEADRKSTRLNSSHMSISYAVFCLKKKNACGCGWRFVDQCIGNRTQVLTLDPGPAR